MRVVVDRFQDPLDDRSDIVETHLQQGLRLDPLDGETDTPEFNIRTHIEFHQVQDLSLQRHPRPEVLDLKLDLVHLDHRDVEQYIRLFGSGSATTAIGPVRPPRKLLLVVPPPLGGPLPTVFTRSGGRPRPALAVAVVFRHVPPYDILGAVSAAKRRYASVRPLRRAAAPAQAIPLRSAALRISTPFPWVGPAKPSDLGTSSTITVV
ncbi:hypothetical protein GCM10023224_08570 [Streptomonospora halophila]|uniref:Uncharacterized protein n=1 Tax=Streptomonospora halophila TaxID=427369 RepID=A0ABP9G7N6_9ACTN